MITLADVNTETTLDDYAKYAPLAPAVEALRATAARQAGRLEDRTVWMVNSTAQGGGVAEMLPKVVSMLRELGINTEWAVISVDDPGFFSLTKRLHNLLHGSGTPHLSSEDVHRYRTVSEDLAQELRRHVAPTDLLVVHDPQPLGAGALLKESLGLPALWRCHVGLDTANAATEMAWDFLEPWITAYDHSIFSLRDYVPDFLGDEAVVINPAIDPLSPKNRPLRANERKTILRRAQLAATPPQASVEPVSTPAKRLQPDGSFAPATQPEALGLLPRPLVTQVSRWDRLKGFAPLLRGFVQMKDPAFINEHATSELHRICLSLSRLALAGPDPSAIADDPEGKEALRELCDLWLGLPPERQQDVALVTLPMESRRTNALMVNALQRSSAVIAQNSVQEGFGLTVTEGMWKGVPILGTRAAGIDEQVVDGETGRLLPRAEDPAAIARALADLLGDRKQRQEWGEAARRRVRERYLVFTQVQRWLDVLAEAATSSSTDPDQDRDAPIPLHSGHERSSVRTTFGTGRSPDGPSQGSTRPAP
jgi:trehalose synthase